MTSITIHVLTACTVLHEYSMHNLGRLQHCLLYSGTAYFWFFFFFCYNTKRSLDLAPGCVCEYYTWHNESSAKMSLLQPPHAVFKHTLLHCKSSHVQTHRLPTFSLNWTWAFSICWIWAPSTCHPGEASGLFIPSAGCHAYRASSCPSA